MAGELAERRRLADTVDAYGEDHPGPGAHLGRVACAVQHGQDLTPKRLPNRVGVVQMRATAQLPDQPVGGLEPDVRREQPLFQRVE